MLNYTTINHRVRKSFGLSMSEYVLVDMVYHLATNPKATISGWCYMKRETMAAEMGMTKQGLMKMIDRVIAIGCLERHPETKYLKPSATWCETYLVNKVDRHGKQSSPEPGKQSLPNKYECNINIGSCDDNRVFDGIFGEDTPKWVIERILDDALRYGLENDHISEFVAYLKETERHFKVRKTGTVAGLKAVTLNFKTYVADQVC